MKANQLFAGMIICIIAAFGCSKDKSSPEQNCPFRYDTTIKIIENQAAYVYAVGGGFIIKLPVSDSILNACNIPVSFQQDSLAVVVSGEVKATTHNPFDLCNCYNFYITGIWK